VLHLVHYAFMVMGCYSADGMGHNSDQSNTDRPTVRHVTVAEAARLLNLSPEEVASREQQGTLDSIRVEDTVYVLWDADQLHSNDDQANVQTKLLQDLRDQVAHLRKQLDQEREATEITGVSSLRSHRAPLSHCRSTSREGLVSGRKSRSLSSGTSSKIRSRVPSTHGGGSSSV
jgi:hypothetical protein